MQDIELTRIEKLKVLDNWGTWKFQVKVLIQAAEALEIVNGSIEIEKLRTSPTGISSADMAEYRKSIRIWNILDLDSKAQRIIATTVSEQPLLHINCHSSKEMWNKFHEVFESKNETVKHILRQWYILEKETIDDMTTYIAKIKDLAHRLKVLGGIYPGMIL